MAIAHGCYPGRGTWDVGERAVQVSAGCAHSLVLTSKGRALAHGSNVYGQLGVGAGVQVHTFEQSEWFDERAAAAWVDLSRTCTDHDPEEARLCAVSAGALHSAFLSERGDVFSCGDNEYGQLGHDAADMWVPQQLCLKPRVLQVCAGARCTLLLAADGRAYCGGGTRELYGGHSWRELWSERRSRRARETPAVDEPPRPLVPEGTMRELAGFAAFVAELQMDREWHP